MKVAIILAGPYRSQDWIMEKHYQNIGKYDTYVSCRENDINAWIESGWDIKEIYITPEISNDEISFDKLSVNDDEISKYVLHNLYWQFKNIGNCWQNIPKKYDYYIKSRCDMVYEYPLNVDFSNIKDNEIWCPSTTFWGYRWIGNGFFNDQLYIAKENVMNFVGNFYKEVHKLNNSMGETIKRELFQNNIAETALILWLANWDIKQKHFDYIYTKNHYGYCGSEYDKKQNIWRITN